MYPKAFRNWTAQYCSNLKNYFNLHDWRLDLVWQMQPSARESALACVFADHRYLSVKIEIYPELAEYWKEKDVDLLAHCFIHEFVHIVARPIEAWAERSASEATSSLLEDEIERQTQRFARIIGQSLPKNLIPPIR